jgi:hypothetical protein
MTPSVHDPQMAISAERLHPSPAVGDTRLDDSHVIEHIADLSNMKVISFLAKVEWIEMQGRHPSGLG